MFSKLTMLRAAGAIRRYHTLRTHRTQTVADHSHGVAMLVLAVYPEAHAELIKAALTHDLPEIVTGDIPATAKWRHPELGKIENEISAKFRSEYGIQYVLSETEHSILKWCDMMELVLWCLEDVQLGNSYAAEVVERGLAYLRGLEHPTHRAVLLLKSVEEAWKELQ